MMYVHSASHALQEKLVEMEDQPGAMQQECSVLPVCDSPTVYDPESCMCVETKGPSTPTVCPNFLYRKSFYNTGCICARAASMQCDSNFYLDQSNGCQCVSYSSPETHEPSCPNTSYRPSPNACYCLLAEDTSCPHQVNLMTSDDCNCYEAQYTTPKCSRQCGWSPATCSCIDAAVSAASVFLDDSY